MGKDLPNADEWVTPQFYAILSVFIIVRGLTLNILSLMAQHKEDQDDHTVGDDAEEVAYPCLSSCFPNYSCCTKLLSRLLLLCSHVCYLIVVGYGLVVPFFDIKKMADNGHMDWDTFVVMFMGLPQNINLFAALFETVAKMMRYYMTYQVAWQAVIEKWGKGYINAAEEAGDKAMDRVARGLNRIVVLGIAVTCLFFLVYCAIMFLLFLAAAFSGIAVNLLPMICVFFAVCPIGLVGMFALFIMLSVIVPIYDCIKIWNGARNNYDAGKIFLYSVLPAKELGIVDYYSESIVHPSRLLMGCVLFAPVSMAISMLSTFITKYHPYFGGPGKVFRFKQLLAAVYDPHEIGYTLSFFVPDFDVEFSTSFESNFSFAMIWFSVAFEALAIFVEALHNCKSKSRVQSPADGIGGLEIPKRFPNE